MRHARHRRRFRYVLAALLVICAVLFLEARIEAFVPEIKSYAETRIGQALDGRAAFSIGSLEGGIFNPIVVNDIKIAGVNIGRSAQGALPSVVISSIRTNYRIWDLLLNKKSRSILSVLFFGDAYIDINFVTPGKEISGFARFKGDGSDGLSFKGYADIPGGARADFNGAIKGSSIDIEARLSKGIIRAKINISDDDSITADIDIEHLRLGTLDIVARGTLKNKKFDGYSEGEFHTDKIILNYTPFLGLSMSYKVSEKEFEILSLDMENSLKASGKVFFTKPVTVDMAIFANNVNLDWLMPAIGARDVTKVLTGTMNGKFEFKGPISDLKSDVRLEIKKGMMSGLEFDCLSANFKGDGPIVRIEDSSVYRESGYFSIAGEMDMRKAGKDSFFENIRMASDDRAINWDDIGTRDIRGVREVRMNKKLLGDISIDFKQFISDDDLGGGSRYNDEVKLEYKLNPSESIKMMLGSDNDFFGLEHRDKF